MKNQKYQIRNLTPQDYECGLASCPAIYDLTPKDQMCAGVVCPAIYEITPGDFECVAGTCPSIHDFQDSYLIIGEQINPKEVGLEKKVGKGEVLIKIQKEIIDNKKPSP